MSLYLQLCGWRLRHLAAATFALLVRRWHAMVFLLLLLSPADMPLAEQLHLLATPVLQAVQTDHPARSIAVWATMLLLAWSWTALQAQAVAGGKAWDHLTAMPLAPRVPAAVDLTVLAIADLPLWLPFVAAVASLALQRTTTSGALAAVLALAGQVPVVQCLALRRPRGVAYCVLGSCAGFAAMGASGQPWLLCAGTLAGMAAGLAHKPRARARIPRLRQPWLALRAHGSPGVQLAAITVRSLFGAGALGRHFGLLLTAAMPAPLFAFLQRGGVQAPVIAVALLLLLPPLLFRVAALALDVKRLHRPMERMHAALGIAAGTLFRITLLVLSAGFAVLSLPLAFTLWHASGSPMALALVPIGMAAMVVVAWLDRSGEPGRFVSRVLVAGLACGALYALL
jgi:hypothetical protein